MLLWTHNTKRFSGSSLVWPRSYGWARVTMQSVSRRVFTWQPSKRTVRVGAGNVHPASHGFACGGPVEGSDSACIDPSSATGPGAEHVLGGSLSQQQMTKCAPSGRPLVTHPCWFLDWPVPAPVGPSCHRDSWVHWAQQLSSLRAAELAGSIPE